VENDPPKKLPQQLTALPKALISSRDVNHGAVNVAPPAFAPLSLSGTQPAPQLSSMILPTPPAPSAVRPAQPEADLEAAQLLVRNNPVYPPVARAAGLSGQVELQFTVGADGSVRNIKVVKGNSVLAQAAAAAVKSWRYKPARRGGFPLESKISAVVIFNRN
jgi:TonB family protein